MSMHKIPLTDLERKGLEEHGLVIGTPSQLSDAFRQGVAWAAATTAAPQPPALGSEPVAYWADAYGNTIQANHKSHNLKVGGTPAMVVERYITPLYAQPATAKVVLPEREILRDVIAAVIGGDAYDCTRVWSAWGVGTMSDDDFVPIVEQEERLYELVDACLDEVAKLNNQPS